MLLILSTFAIWYLAPENAESENGDFDIVEIASGLYHPWSLEFMPDGRMLVTERSGSLRVVLLDGNILPPIIGLPEIFAESQGGLLDVIIDPDFANNNFIYFSFSEPDGDDKAGTSVAKATLVENSLKDVDILFQQVPKVTGGGHFGSRLVFSNEGKLFVTLGDRQKMEEAQNLKSHLGTLVRINKDGSVPEDNPFVGNDNVLPEIFSYGHRNMQGAALHPESGKLWIHEHGPRGGDEINIPQASKNYGWPNASYGRHYSMLNIEDNHSGQGYEEPVYHWTPSIAPSGMMFYTGDIFPKWKGSLFVGALAKNHIARLELDGEKVVKEVRLFEELGYRIRDITQDKEGYIYFLTDSDDGKIFKIVPK